MSADLLAELDSFYTGNSNNKSGKGAQPSQPPIQQATPANDPFSFVSPTFAPNQPSYQPPPQQPQAWSSFQTQTQQSGSSWGNLTGLDSLQSNTKDNGQDDDGWGDFEVATPVVDTAPPAPKPSNNTSISSVMPAANSNTTGRTRIVRAPTLDLMTNNLVDFGAPSSTTTLETWHEQPPTPLSQPQVKNKNSDPNVLFDADDFDGVAPSADSEDDDFGDFETVDTSPVKPPVDLISTNVGSPTSPAKIQPPSQFLSTLSINASPTSPYPQAPRSPSFQERNPFPGLGLKTPVSAEIPKDVKPTKSPSPVTAWPSLDSKPKSAAKKSEVFDDDWAEFEEFPPEAASPAPHASPPKQAAKQIPKAQPSPPQSTWDWDAVDSAPSVPSASKAPQPAAAAADVSSIPDDVPPPTNIPPPSILLSIFPELFERANTALLKPTANQPAPVKSRVLSDPATATFLRGHLLLATVAARVLAGRKQRWHRDKFLAQGMSISAAGGKGGMKLAGVDKAQTAREDREAADVVAAWRGRVGRLRSAVAAANAAGAGGEGPPLRVPEISDKMAVQTAKMVPTAPKACVVCGLKRDERVGGVDVDVEDSFGEWWVEYWGHRACRNFWLEHEGMLRQR
ncbi:Serine threonine-protein kinase ppk6 [Pleurostoma richardsiae]|uniref:Serine threonine-protein kinase ppk6 n=1 Tax=Pleurostoma richardsiae TaxID=41990 RepID=A0AA38VK99_9PEZI|nr:Serine threonine-protein kinase ppk6 [Pleurostoma richardsiae]